MTILQRVIPFRRRELTLDAEIRLKDVEQELQLLLMRTEIFRNDNALAEINALREERQALAEFINSRTAAGG